MTRVNKGQWAGRKFTWEGAKALGEYVCQLVSTRFLGASTVRAEKGPRGHE